MKMKKISLAFLWITAVWMTLFFCPAVSADETICDFRSASGWNRGEWADIRSARYPQILNRMIQANGFICNPVPANLSDRDVQDIHYAKAYSGMLLKKEFSEDVEVSAQMSFDYRMAPLLLFAESPVKQPDDTLLLYKYWEVVLWDQGINVWRHDHTPGSKLKWQKVAHCEFKLEPRKIYELSVKLKTLPGGKRYITIRCQDKMFGFLTSAFSQKFNVGLIACEGRNRFYQFKVSTVTKK